MIDGVKLICFYGPESVGKSSLAERMAKKYNTEFVPEVARELITSNDFTAEDIIRIVHAQLERINQKIRTANKLLFCDTDAITTQIYSKYYLNAVPEILQKLEQEVKYDLYFLFDIDVPWVADGLRDLPHMRQHMFSVFRNELEKRKIPYVLVNGGWEQREKIVTEAVEKLMQC
jgi:HTH-type transcriptional regulator, transcriptional repressor of NAD biosynthesis genes